jgi:hypothetical protein
MKTFVMTIFVVAITGTVATSMQKQDNIKFEKQEQRVDSMLIVANRLDAQLNQISK